MRAVVLTAAVAIAGLAGFGIWQLGEDDGERQELAPPSEISDPVFGLPRGWLKTANAAGGFGLGVPPGWSAKVVGAKTTLKSPGSGVVVSITADRSGEAVGAGLEGYAVGIAERLAGGATPRPAGTPKMLGPGYEAAAVQVTQGAASASPGQRLEVVVVRRPELAAYPILVASGATVKRAQLDPIVNRLVASLRGRAVTAGAG